MRASSRLLISLGFAAAPAFASAQWQWIENDGRKVFSDRPPPISVPEKNIISQPGNRGINTAPPTTTGIAAGPHSAPANPPVGSKAPHEMASKALDEARKKLETAEADKQKIVEANNAKARADNCARARQSKQTFDSGGRVTRMNAQGEREYLDDAAKTTELAHLQTIIASDCRP